MQLQARSRAPIYIVSTIYSLREVENRLEFNTRNRTNRVINIEIVNVPIINRI